MSDLNPGLEGVVVAQTRLSHVDGDAGELIICGHRVEQLAQRYRFEEVCEQLLGSAVRLGDARRRAFELLPNLGDALELKDGMSALRAALSHLTAESAEDMLGAAAVFAAAWAARQRGEVPLAPDPRLPHADDYLRMATGGQLEPAKARALDHYLVTVSDHGMNASTFTARVIASTGSDLVSATVGAVGALKGPLHGGAPGPVLDMLDAIGAPNNAERWLTHELEAGRRIMGMGHRIYRVRDPRAAVLEQAIEELEAAGVSTGRLTLARAVERAAAQLLRAKYPGRSLQANVEFYTAVLLDTVGLPRGAFAPTFAVARMAGWCAHVAEQRSVGKLIRPASKYTGPRPEPACR